VILLKRVSQGKSRKSYCHLKMFFSNESIFRSETVFKSVFHVFNLTTVFLLNYRGLNKLENIKVKFEILSI